MVYRKKPTAPPDPLLNGVEFDPNERLPADFRRRVREIIADYGSEVLVHGAGQVEHDLPALADEATAAVLAALLREAPTREPYPGEIDAYFAAEHAKAEAPSATGGENENE